MKLLDFFKQAHLDHPFNAGTVTEGGLEASKCIETCREHLAQNLKVKSNQIYFVSGGTEANNAVIRSSAENLNHQGVIWLSATAHPSQMEVVKSLANTFKVIEMKTEAGGWVDVKALSNLESPDMLVCEWVNSEAGFLQPIESMISQAKEKNPKVEIHLDGAQGFAKCPLPDLSHIASFTFSGHKFMAPVGSGGLYLSKMPKSNWLHGGGQERAYRSGTQSVAMIKTMTEAFKQAQSCKAATLQSETLQFYRDAAGDYSPWIWHLNTDPIDGEVLLHHLEQKGLYIGLGSACRASRKKMSQTHRAIGLSEDQSRKSVRLSIGLHTEQKELDQAIQWIQESLTELKRFF